MIGAFSMLTVEIYNFLIGCPLPMKMPWCPCPFKNKAFRPEKLIKVFYIPQSNILKDYNTL